MCIRDRYPPGPEPEAFRSSPCRLRIRIKDKGPILPFPSPSPTGPARRVHATLNHCCFISFSAVRSAAGLHLRPVCVCAG
eukprot:9441817-Lingulodinium_polyedra.AAC.1